jgi:YggT family protein
MGVEATVAVLANAVTTAETFVSVFFYVYIIIIFIYVLSSWIRLPYSPTVSRIQRFLYDVCEPYLRLFRRILPPLGPIDLSPLVGVIVLVVVEQLILRLLAQFE